MTKSFAIVFTVLSLALLSVVFAQFNNINNEEEKSEATTALINET